MAMAMVAAFSHPWVAVAAVLYCHWQRVARKVQDFGSRFRTF